MHNEWLEWHRGYDGGQPRAQRLRVVQDRLREALDRRPSGLIRVVSMCAGDGRDLLGVLAGHPRAHDVLARLVELTPELVEAGRERASREGLRGVEFTQGDASFTSAYADAVPADIVLVCGVFGNITDQDVRGTIDRLPELCARDATVIWTRGRFEPDLTPTIREWFAAAGFTEVSFVAIPGTTLSVGTHRLTGAPKPFRSEGRLFTFLPREERPSARAEHHPGTSSP
ncbi:MAG TPA: class I SAM-dependent methyltransferase [Thermoplasmata archaeon]|nr:class I SAM-dependent methyltransferase [Thermoplasmata archaeon]